jgi:hypothetical protein
VAPIPALYIIGEGLIAPVLKNMLCELFQDSKAEELAYLVVITWSLELEGDAVNDEVRNSI